MFGIRKLIERYKLEISLNIVNICFQVVNNWAQSVARRLNSSLDLSLFSCFGSLESQTAARPLAVNCLFNTDIGLRCPIFSRSKSIADCNKSTEFSCQVCVNNCVSYEELAWFSYAGGHVENYTAACLIFKIFDLSTQGALNHHNDPAVRIVKDRIKGSSVIILSVHVCIMWTACFFGREGTKFPP